MIAGWPREGGKFDQSYFLQPERDKRSGEWKLFYKEQIREIRRHLGGKGVRICDCGCGLGDFLNFCDKEGWETHGVDISQYAILQARKRTRAILRTGDIQEEIPFEGGFDAMTCFDVVEHLPSPENALTNIYRKLKRGGILLITTPNLRSGVWRKISGWQLDKTHISLKKQQEWERCLKEIGFSVTFSRTAFPKLSHMFGIKSLVAKVLSKIGLGSTLLIMATKREG